MSELCSYGKCEQLPRREHESWCINQCHNRFHERLVERWKGESAVQDPTVGRVLLYKLSANDVARARGRNMLDTQTTFNAPYAGEIVPLVVVRVWPNEYPNNEEGLSKAGVNGQALLDGNFTLWITSAGEGDGNGQWRWPALV